MDQQQTQQLAQQFIDALHTLEQGDVSNAEQNVSAMVELFSDDATLTNAALKLTGEERNGTDGATTFWTEYRKTFGEAYSDFFQITANDESAGLFWTTKGTGKMVSPWNTMG